MTRNNADFHGVTFKHHGQRQYIPGGPPTLVHHFTAHHNGSEVGFLQLFGTPETDRNEVANIEVDKTGKGIGEGLIRFAKSKGFSPSRSEAESDEGKGFFTRLQEKGLV